MPTPTPDKLTLRAIEIFLAVAEEGSFGAGAQRLGASVSTVSQQVANLERALGAALIDRDARPLALTPAGRVFQGRAIAVMDELARARAEIAALDLHAVRALRLAVIEDLESAVLPELLTRLARLFPACNFIVRTGQSHENLAALEQRTTDLALMADSGPLPEWAERHPILREPLILVAAPGLVSEASRAEALAQAPMIRFEHSQPLARQIEAQLRRVRLGPYRRFEVETNAAMVAMVARARGWAIATPLGLLGADGAAGTVEAHPAPFPAQARSITVCARRGTLGHLPGAVSEVLRGVIEETVLPRARRRMPWLGAEMRTEPAD